MGEKVSVDELILCVVSSKVIAILKSQYVNCSKNPKNTVWDNQKKGCKASS